MSDPYNRHDELVEFGALTDPADPAWVAEAAHKAAALGGDDDDIELPPDRVRFSAPLVVEAPDVDEPCDGVVVNLSATGLACVLPLPLHPGERVACRFRPALGEQHIELEADVVWRRRAGGEDSLYGLCFVEVPEVAAQRLDDLVRERSEGRAGEWPLPAAPAAESPAPARRRSSAYVAATLGVAAGAVLSLGLSILPDMLLGGATSRPLLPSRALASSADPATLRTPPPAAKPETSRKVAAVTPEAVRPAAPAVPADASAGMSARPAVEPATAKLAADPKAADSKPAADSKLTTKPTAELEKATTKPASDPKPAAIAKPTTDPKPAADPKPTAPAAVLDFSGTRASLDLEPEPRRAADAKPSKPAHTSHASSSRKLEVTQSAHEGEVTLRIDRAAASFKSFWLDDPRRLVVDVPAAHSLVDAGEQVLAGPLANRLRIGEHADKVRFVLELAPGVGAEVKAAGSALVVKLSKH